MRTHDAHDPAMIRPAAKSPELPLFAPMPPSNGTRTSNAAAESVRESAKSLRQRVLNHLLACGKAGATDEEMQAALGMNPSTQRPRRGELVVLGLVCDSGATRPTTSGRQATVWVAGGGK